MEAIVLAGGLGTRLRPVITEVPKPMAPVAGRPFLDYILYYLKQQGISRVVLAVGYKWEVIRAYYNANSSFGLELDFSVEEEPLGTGGAIFQAADKITDERFFVINGDTSFNVSLNELAEFSTVNSAEITLALKTVDNAGRYGTVGITESGRIISFLEKGQSGKPVSAINGGVYLMEKALVGKFDLPAKFSFETDFLHGKLDQLKAYGKTFDASFIDIGIPEDYYRAQELFKDAIHEEI
jgi:D-glycero-alpha-D-manno-heptose 1-phosphate guanylyltransferase